MKRWTSQLNKERKILYAEVAKIYSKNKSFIHEIVKEEKEIHASFVVTPQAAKVMVIVCDKCLVIMKKTFNMWVEDMRENVFQLMTMCCARKHWTP